MPNLSLQPKLGVFEKAATLQPHRSRYWEHPNIADWDEFALQVEEICTLHATATEQYAASGVNAGSVDEKPGMQAIERDGATLPTQLGLVERREFNSIRHGTQVLTVNLHLATGKLLTPTIQDRRTEVDFVAHITRTVNTDPQAPWVFLCDQLNTHKSESLVRYVAESIGDTQNLGEKGKTGILKDMTNRQAYLSDPQHRIRFLSTPKHCSWLNSVEVWFSILTTHVLKRGNFTSIADLQQKLMNYMTYYNKHLAKAWNWSVIKTTDIHQLIDKVQQIECAGTFRGLAE